MKLSSRSFLKGACATILASFIGTAVTAQEFQALFSHGFKPDSPHHAAALQMVDEVAEASGGRIEIKVFHSGQAGTARENFEALQLGSLQITTSPTARIAGFVPELQVFDLPFLFPSYDKMVEVLDGPVGQEMLGLLAPQNVLGVAFYIDGLKNMTANKPLRTLADFEGFKMRTMESPIIMEQYRALGANPVPLDFLEVYNALQMGTVDGQENPTNLIHDMKFYEVQDYLTLTEHAMLGGILMFSQDWYNSLPDDLQAIMMDAGVTYVQRQRVGVQQIVARDLEAIEASGTKIIELTAEERDVFREATLPVHKIYTEQYGDAMLSLIYDAAK
ncbi:TRAP transporter substrate-binding protein [Antarctobacter sp.]|uniref:TRAP transporter substrate-binding protein n=1 Tax=Antarctobacter sp. TaxID=1872577 RepID=UPI002B27B241|nr:TRAP transporter substrate-binding protein [Antarctobacter sp.]